MNAEADRGLIAAIMFKDLKMSSQVASMAAMFAAVRMPRNASLPRRGSNHLFVQNSSVPTRQKFLDAMETVEKANQSFQLPF